MDTNNISLLTKIQDKELFNDILERNYYNFFKKGEKSIEIFLNGICKANCEYCYLKKHQKELFPIELYNKDKIINNLQLILNWYIENKFTCTIDIFSGEWLTTELRTPVLNILYNTFKNIKPPFRPKAITIPDNMLFIKNKQYTEEIQSYINKFKELKIPLFLSASIDGKYCDFGRTEVDDSFYNDVISFIEKNNFGVHPMISSSNIKYWIQNYLWFYEKSPRIATQMMMLEVRNETWDKQSITELLKFCDFLIDFRLKNTFNNNLKKYANFIFNDVKEFKNYSPERIYYQNFDKGRDRITCSIQTSLPIRVSDLKIILCHRLAYKELELGTFEIKDNKIISAIPENIALLIMKIYMKKSCLPHCEKCPITGICLGHCLGNAYENYKNPLVPPKQVCDLYRAKNSFLIQKYNDLGLFDIIEKENIITDEIYLKYLLNLKNSILNNL